LRIASNECNVDYLDNCFTEVTRANTHNRSAGISFRSRQQSADQRKPSGLGSERFEVASGLIALFRATWRMYFPRYTCEYINLERGNFWLELVQALHPRKNPAAFDYFGYFLTGLHGTHKFRARESLVRAGSGAPSKKKTQPPLITLDTCDRRISSAGIFG
jgi:hypothetical protein